MIIIELISRFYWYFIFSMGCEFSHPTSHLSNDKKFCGTPLRIFCRLIGPLARTQVGGRRMRRHKRDHFFSFVESYTYSRIRRTRRSYKNETTCSTVIFIISLAYSERI